MKAKILTNSNNSDQEYISFEEAIKNLFRNKYIRLFVIIWITFTVFVLILARNIPEQNNYSSINKEQGIGFVENLIESQTSGETLNKCTYDTATRTYDTRDTEIHCYGICNRAELKADPKCQGDMCDCRCYTCNPNEKERKTKGCQAIPTYRPDGLADDYEECDRLCDQGWGEPGKHEAGYYGVICLCCEDVSNETGKNSNVFEIFVTASTYCVLHGGAALPKGGNCDEFESLLVEAWVGNKTSQQQLYEKYGQYAENE